LAVALGVGPRLLRRVQVEPLEQFGAALGVEAPAQASDQVYRLAARERRPQRHVARDVRQLPMQGDGVPPGVTPEERDRTGIRPEETEQDPEGRGLSGSVRPEETVHFARSYCEVQPVER